MLRSCLGVDGDPRSVAMRREVSRCDEKGCFATRSVRCVGSVATRREVLLSNDKSDFVTISVVTSLDPPVGSADSSRSVYAALLDGLSPSLLAASFRRTSRQFHRHFSNVYSLLGGSAASLSPLSPS